MGGGPFPYRMNIRKNKFVEEWNGRREITEKAFWIDGKKVFPLFFYCAAVPFGFYYFSGMELRTTGGRRFKDCL